MKLSRNVALWQLSICFFFHAGFFLPVRAQQPTEVKVSVVIIRNLRHIQNVPHADEIAKEVIARKYTNSYVSQPVSQYHCYRKTSVDFVADKATLEQRMQSRKNKTGTIYQKYIVPFESWLDYAREVPNTDDLALTVQLYEDYHTVYKDHRKNIKKTQIHASRNVGFLEFIGQQNGLQFLDEMFGDIDLYKNEVELMLLHFKSPLADDALKTYQYQLLGYKQINGNDCYEIAFFAQKPTDNAFAGYLYVDVSSFALHKAVFTLNNSSNMNFLKDILITHTYTQVNNIMYPAKKESSVVLGDEMEGCLSVVRTLLYAGSDSEKLEKKSKKTIYDEDFYNRDSLYWQSVRLVPLTASQSQIDGLVKIAPENTVYTNVQKLLMVLLSNHISIRGVNGKVELGPVLQFISRNDMEGFRLKIGGNTTTALMNQFQLGGYVAYGLKDERWKYRGDLIYSFLPRDKYIWEYPQKLLSLSYVNDLNIPGQDLLTSNRDNALYSFSHTIIDNMSLQRIGLLTFENEIKHNFSYKIGAKYTSDKPVGVVNYMKIPDSADTIVVNNLNTAELAFSIRYAPNEKFFQNRDQRVPIRRGNIELLVNHRVGIKGVFGSDYQYQITTANAYKKLKLGNAAGNLDLYLSAGKVWDKVPFPLLFIPMGNQSYIFQTENYNCMDFYEFTTDRFVAGNANFLFNWSPVNWLNKRSKIRTSIGARAIYGPLSDKNNPEFHPDLFVFNKGVTPLGKTPYVEANIGLANVFKILRIEYVRRFTYISNPVKGSLLVTGSFAF